MSLAHHDDIPPALGDDDPFDDLWARLSRPFEMVPTVAAVVGLPARAVAQMVGMAVARSPEAEALLAGFSSTIRSLATSIHTNAERCIGSLRGPVLWSETMSARASSFGDPDLFVCSTPARAYDIDENHVLVYALAELRDAARLASDAAGPSGGDDLALRTVRRNALHAGRFLDHPSLRDVSRKKPGARAIKRTRSGKHRKTYGAALRMVERAATPLTAEDVRSWCDDRTRAQHHVLMGVVNRLEQAGNLLPAFRVQAGSLRSGPVLYAHPRFLGDRGSVSGILIGRLLIDVPDRLQDPNRRRAEHLLKARANGRQAMLVMDERDIDRAVEAAIELGRDG